MPNESITALELIRRRISDRSSTPHNRNDPFRLSLIGCSGAMAGALSAAVTAKLEAHNLLRIFDLSVGVSAGAIVNTYFLAGQATEGSCMIPTFLSNNGYQNDGVGRRYIDWFRLFSREHVWDLSMCLDGLMLGRCQLDFQAMSNCGIQSYCVASTELGEAVLLPLSSLGSTRTALEATCRIPLIIDKIYSPDKLWDGSFVTHAPVDFAAKLGATHHCVLRNSTDRSAHSRILVRLLAILIRRKNKTLANTLLRSQLSTVPDYQPKFANTVFEYHPTARLGSFEAGQKTLWSAMIIEFCEAQRKLELPPTPLPRLWIEQIEASGHSPTKLVQNLRI